MTHEPVTFQLAYGDCDTVGIAYFALYYPWMERAQTLWLYSHGLRSGELVDQLGVMTVGVHSECTYLKMVRVFDKLRVDITRDRVGSSSYTLGFDFVRGPEVVAHGAMTFACRTPEGARSAIPNGLLDVLSTLLEPTRETP